MVFLRGQAHWHSPQQPGNGLIQAKGRRGDDDLISGVQNRGESNKEALGGANGQNDFLRVVAQAVGSGLVIRDGLEHVRVAIAGGIVGVVSVQGGLGGLLDGVGSVLIRLSDSQGTGAGGISHQICKAADAGDFHA